MSGFLSSLIWRGISEKMLINQDIERFRGKKAVAAIMAIDRNHAEFKKAQKIFADLKDSDDLVLVTEDHPEGPLHERFHCQPQEFCFALVDKNGNDVMRGDHAPDSLSIVRQRLE